MITRNKVEQSRIDIHTRINPPAILGKAGPYCPDIMVDDEGIVIRSGNYRLRGETVAAKKEVEKGRLARRAQQEKIIFAMGEPHSRVVELDALDIDVMGVTTPLYSISTESSATRRSPSALQPTTRWPIVAPRRGNRPLHIEHVMAETKELDDVGRAMDRCEGLG